MLKVLSHLMKLQCSSNCASNSAVLKNCLGLLVLSATEVFSFCLSKKFIIPCAYTIVFEILVSFVLKHKFMCKMQDDVNEGFKNFSKFLVDS